MLHMVWKVIKLTFQPNKPHVIWSFQDGVIVKTLNTAQKSNSHTETQQEASSKRPFHIVRLIFFISCFYLSRRVVPCINIPLLHSIHRLLIMEYKPPFVQLCANKYWERSLPLCSCDFLCGIYRSGGFIRSQLVLLLPSRFPRLIVGCVGWFFESVVGRILDSGCRLKTVVGFEFYLPGCTSYRCLQQVIRLFFS
jgi:hypothetical protein